ncbi:hypothetical protein EJ73_00869 [Hoylesella shahii DSM 15611 = JCM 12083]|uniref:Uncharacterized protein n=1 Tax=Hoylesella shahii DSM 15611 = JCM 12083 TaxID=1122991 RepID=A0A318IEN5_9BACT|nr:hypothetical protein EJ73_00869 [Hoylesella shahii DSM 15611 = JCM 12083]
MVNKLYKTHLSAPCILGKYKVKIYIKSSKSVKKVSCRNAFCASFFAIYFAIAFFFRKNEPYLYSEEHQIYLINLQDVEEYAEF